MIIPQGDSPGMGGSHSGHRYVGHTHFWERALYSRRQFVKTSMGVTGAVLGSELWLPGLAQAHTASVAPKPIPGGFQPLGPGTELFHVFLIEHGAEISTITDFHGSIGGAEIQGTGTATHTNTGKKEALLFDVDMRFMKGVYVGVDGEKHRGTFGFIWLDLYQGSLAPTNQIHDFSPGNVPGGLFWTIPIPDKSVEVNLAEAKASMVVSNVGTRDFFNIPNNLTHGKSIHANVSFRIHWHGVKNHVHLHDETNQFDASMIEDTATISWSAHEEDFSFVSDSEETSTTVFAEIGHERNGVFF